MDIYKNYTTSLDRYEEKYKSKHWKKYDLRLDLFKRENLKNFRNNSLSDGLDDRYDIPHQKKIFKNLIKEVGEDYVLKNLNNQNIGNSKYVFKYKDKYVDGGQNFHIKWLYEFEKNIVNKKNIKSVCEIGGGYGSFAQKIIKRFNCKYVSIDLPEGNFLASYYLKNHFKDLSIVGNCELINNELDEATFDKNDIFILNPWNKISNIKFDLIINTRSMMEMNKDVIKYYFDFIHTHIKKDGFFLNINRYRKKSVGYPVHFYEYPYDSSWNIVLSKKSWRQYWIHFLLTQRSLNEKKNKIKEELIKIKRITYFFILQEKLLELKKMIFIFLKKIIKFVLFMK
jgi:putative sugar O-methyltransferase